MADSGYSNADMKVDPKLVEQAHEPELETAISDNLEPVADANKAKADTKTADAKN